MNAPGRKELDSIALRIGREGSKPFLAAVQEAMRLAAEALGVERASTWMFIEDHQSLSLVDLYERTPDRHSADFDLPRASYPRYFKAIEDAKVLSITHVESDPRTMEFVEGYTRPLGIRSMLDGAIRLAGDVVGVVCFEHTGDQRDWTEEEATFAVEVTNLIAQWLIKRERDRAVLELSDQSRLLLGLAESQGHALSGRHEDMVAWFDQMLQTLLQLSGSEYGFIGSIEHDEKGAPFLRTHAITNIAWDAASRAFYEEHKDSGFEFRNLDTLFGVALKTGELVIANEPDTDGRAGGRPHGHPPLTAFAGIPLVRGDQFLGLVGLANRPGGYASDIETELGALLSAITSILGFHADQRELKEGRLRLVESEERRLAAQKATGGGDWNIDFRKGTIVFSEGAYELLGIDPETPELQLMDFLETFYVDVDVHEALARVNRARDRIGAIDVHRRVRVKSGLVRWIHITGMIERDDSGQPCTGSGQFLDITDRKDAEALLEVERTSLEEKVLHRTAELQSANMELERAGRLKDEFLASMSHELRTPLNTILGMSEALAEGAYGELTDTQTGQLTFVHESGTHLLSLINDILDVAKIESGQMALDEGDVVLSELVDGALRLVGSGARKKRLAVARTDDLGVGSIRADGRRLKQVLVNLLSNAVKFTPAGGNMGVEVEGDREAKRIRITVWDEGIGISEEDQGRLFDPFVQLDGGLSRSHEGTGLGLTIARKIAEMHGGTLDIESRPGEGSRFTMTIPWRDTLSGPREAVHSEQHLKGSEPDTTRERPKDAGSLGHLLLAEDNEQNIQTYASYLRQKGYDVTIARNGREAVEMVERERPALVLMDVQMPEMDGLEATRRIRSLAEGADVPIVALTAMAMHGDREKCLEAGVDAYLSKPVKLTELVATIEDHIAGS